MSKDLDALRENFDKSLSKFKDLNLTTQESTLSVLAMVAPIITIEARRIANALENILEAMYNPNK